MTVLVLATETDRTADSVITGLTERNVPVMRVDTSWFPQNMSLNAEFRDGRCSGVLCTTHHEVDLGDIRSVWVRTPSAYSFPDTMSAAERDYARREAKIGVGGALLALPDVLWVNRPGVVVKPLTANLLYEDNTYKMGWTRKLSADDLADLRGVNATAHLVQDWVEKAWECRAVVVGDEVFAVAIHAGSEAARIDWRSDYPALSYEVIDLPLGVENALRAIMDELGLVYGAFDLSVSNDGGSEIFWFLEINPGGQYGFLEGETGIPITDSLVRFLAKRVVA
ncbi:MAG: MvdC/MvdD family ATP grasp protein [Pseudonocardiaceae bacterium]